MPELHWTVPDVHGHHIVSPPVPCFLFHFVMDRDGCVPDEGERAQKGETLSGKIESPGEVRSKIEGYFDWNCLSRRCCCVEIHSGGGGTQ